MTVGSWLGCILAAYLLGIISAMCGIRKLQTQADFHGEQVTGDER